MFELQHWGILVVGLVHSPSHPEELRSSRGSFERSAVFGNLLQPRGIGAMRARSPMRLAGLASEV